MPAKKNLKSSKTSEPEIQETVDTSTEDSGGAFDSVFGGAFGGSFGSAFGDGIEVKFNTDGSTSKSKVVRTKKVAPVKTEATPTPLRSSSRTFSIQTEDSKDTNKKTLSKSNEAWVDELTRGIEKRNKTAGSTPVTLQPNPISENLNEVSEASNTSTASPSSNSNFSAPTFFRSKIITAEDRKKEEAKKVTTTTPATTPVNKTAIEDRGTAFAKTFIKSHPYKKPFRPTTDQSSTNRFSNPRDRNFFKPKGPKVKNAPTLKTRVSGKSLQNKIELVKDSGEVVERRAPVVSIMGHVDHGKSTLLDYIRSTNVADREVGGITQKMSAYEVEHNGQKITFLDTPGHEAFTTMRARGASAADIAILVVSAEDGVKPQTLDALKAITDARTPFFIGASKIDKPNADIEKTKQSLAENSIYVEGYGGDISIIPFSGKTGKGVDDLLDMILLMADVADIKATYDVPAECLVIEAGRDKVRGIQASVIVKNGTLKTGSYIVSGGEISPVRIIENFEGKQIKEALPGQPVRIMGWTAEPRVGDVCVMTLDKTQAELLAVEQKEMITLSKELEAGDTKPASGIQNLPQNIRVLYGLEKSDTWTFPVVLKADSVGTLDALKQEIGKIKLERINIKVIRAETGDINENDIKLAQGSTDSVVLGYNTKVDAGAKRLAEINKTTIETFDIIYKLIEWVSEEAQKRAPRVRVEESHATLKVLKVFSANKHKQVLGGRVETGTLGLGNTVKILRRDNEIGRGEVVELQQMRVSTKSVEEGAECGLMVESKIEIVAGDVLSAVSYSEK